MVHALVSASDVRIVVKVVHVRVARVHFAVQQLTSNITVQCSAEQCDAAGFNILQYNTIQRKAIKLYTLPNSYNVFLKQEKIVSRLVSHIQVSVAVKQIRYYFDPQKQTGRSPSRPQMNKQLPVWLTYRVLLSGDGVVSAKVSHSLRLLDSRQRQSSKPRLP